MTKAPVKKLLVFLPSLGGGGAEKNTLRLINQLQAIGYEIVVCVAKRGGEYEGSLSPNIQILDVSMGGFQSSLLRVLSCASRLRHTIKRFQPDFVLSVMDLESVVAALSLLWSPKKPRLIVSIQNKLFAQSRSYYRFILKVFLKWTFSRAHTIVALSEGVRNEIIDFLPKSAPKTLVIHNIGLPSAPEGFAGLEAPSPKTHHGHSIQFVACGRLTEQKGYPYLLQAFSAVSRHIQCRLLILGSGPLKGALEQLSEDLGIRSKIEFAGFIEAPWERIRGCDIFVLSSLWEGFANVIVEAMAVGVPVIATSCKHGPSEIITHAENGILVPPQSTEDLAAAMAWLSLQPSKRKAFAEAGIKRAAAFSGDRIAKQWHEVFSQGND